ncbi:MAG: sensor histidine kinase [Lachnospiraceae bacterium]|nr:sensor histidine kinase [Lachnospiraceae bacterium]
MIKLLKKFMQIPGTFFTRLRRHFVYKVFLSYFFLITVLLLLVIIVNSYRMTQRELDSGVYSGTNTLNQTASYIQYRVQEINGIINVITYSDTIKQALIDGENYYSHSVANWNIQTSRGIKEILYGSYTSNDISKIRLYATSGELSFEATERFQKLPDERKKQWYDRMANAPGNYVWLPSSFFDDDTDKPAILMVSRIAALDNIKKYLGYIISTIPESTFSQILNQAGSTENTSVLLFNSHGEVIVRNDSCLPFFTPEKVKEMAEEYHLASRDSLKEIQCDGSSYLVGLRTIDKSDWTLAIMIPSADLLASSRQLLHQMILLVFVVLLFCMPVIYMTSRSLTSRIVVLKKQMSDFSHGIIVPRRIDNGNDEIGDLTDSFYHMQVQIQKLMKEQYEQGVAIKDLELQVLQSQINPHFLYNTLDMIYWMGIRNQAPEVSTAASELGAFYKLSLGNGESIVTLEDEIRHIEAYIDIQNLRFNNSIILQNNVPLSLYPYQIIKVTLQPLIENAITHGIREKESESGTIFLDAAKEEDKLYITVTDDGVGMTKERLLHIFNRRNHLNGHGYGVWNIHERIKLTYGAPYGLQYDSTPGIGTRVTIILPLKLFL